MERGLPLTSTMIGLGAGMAMPSPGFGTWRMGEEPGAAETELAALRRAHERGFRHFDTAEMYGDGGAEELLGRALADMPRDEVFVTSKVYPWNAGRAEMEAACARSLTRLGVERLDLYLLHWPGSVPLEETLDGAERLIEAGMIAGFGVSNFDMDQMQALIGLDGNGLVRANQVLHNPARRGIEFDLLPLLEREGIACIAYTPLEPERCARNAGFRRIAAEAGLSPAALAFAWHLSRGRTCPIPKSATPAHVDALADAAAVRLGEDVLAAIDGVFPPPEQAQPLDIL